MPMLDVFGSDAFSVRSLTDAIQKIKHVPGLVGRLGLFQTTGVIHTLIAIEERDGQLSLISPSARGGPGTTLTKNLRTLRSFSIPHFEINDGVMAEEVQGVRAWGSETDVETVQKILADRLMIHGNSLDATEEYARLGAVKGIVTYADSSTLNLFTEFGVSQISEVTFSLSASSDTGVVRTKCSEVIRDIAGVLEGTPFGGVTALCSDTFFDALIACAEVRNTYLNQVEAQELRAAAIDNGANGAFGNLSFGGVQWINYRGAVGNTSFITAGKAHFFPTGVPGLFRSYYAPADYNETVNTIGQARYARQYEMPNGKGVHLDVQTNPLHICTRPRTLIQGAFST